MSKTEPPVASTASSALNALGNALQELAEAAFDLTSLLGLTARKIGQALDAAVLVTTVSPDGNWLVPSSMFHRDPRLAADYLAALTAIPAPVGTGEIGVVIATGAGLSMRELDSASWADAAHEKCQEVIRRLDARSLLIVPMRAHGKAVGALSAYRGVGAPAFGGVEQHALQGVADALGAIVGRQLGGLAQIANEAALVETQERLRAADRRKDEFLAIMGHELRNPLAPLMTAAHMIRLRGGQASEKEMGVLDRQLRQMSKIVADLLQASSAMRQDVQLALKVVEIGDLLAGAVDLAAPFIEERQHQLSLDVAEHGMPVSADAERMAQVFGNVLHNAAKYTPPGGSIRLSATNLADTVQITVEDNGQGMAPELIESVFDLFTQGDAGKESGGGLGIGLAVSRKLVMAHGGQIEAQSKGVGHGSRFTIRLPRAAHSAEESPPSTPPLLRKAAVARRILIADDNHDTVELMEALLGQYGHQLRTAMDGPSALAAYEEFRPDIVFLDIGLPGMDGYQVAKRIRELPSGESITIVAVSGYARHEDRARALESGFSMHLAKPFDVETLVTIIDGVY